MNQSTQYNNFVALHHSTSSILILPNAWDVCSARIIESLGAKAVATTSAGVAWARGYRDGGSLPMAIQIGLAEALVDSLQVPVTMDVENGYADAAGAVANNLHPLIETGIAGINIEDGGDLPSVVAKKIEAIKRIAATHGLNIFVNVRTDVYLRNLCPDAQKVATTVTRAALYRSAGADGLFVPGLADPEHIRRITSETTLPLNVMAVPGLAAADELSRMGVRRLSTGSGLAQCMWKNLSDHTRAFLAAGDTSTLVPAMDYGDLQNLMV